MDEEEDDEESGDQLFAHRPRILPVLEPPEEIAEGSTEKGKEEVD